MGRSVAQPVVVSIGGNQTVEIVEPVESRSSAQQATVTLSSPQLVIIVSPAQRLPSE